MLFYWIIYEKYIKVVFWIYYWVIKYDLLGLNLLYSYLGLFNFISLVVFNLFILYKEWFCMNNGLCVIENCVLIFLIF